MSGACLVYPPAAAVAATGDASAGFSLVVVEGTLKTLRRWVLAVVLGRMGVDVCLFMCRDSVLYCRSWLAEGAPAPSPDCPGALLLETLQVREADAAPHRLERQAGGGGGAGRGAGRRRRAGAPAQLLPPRLAGGARWHSVSWRRHGSAMPCVPPPSPSLRSRSPRILTPPHTPTPPPHLRPPPLPLMGATIAPHAGRRQGAALFQVPLRDGQH